MSGIKYITCRGCLKPMMVLTKGEQTTRQRCASCSTVNVLRFSQAGGWSVTKEEEIQHGHQ